MLNFGKNINYLYREQTLIFYGNLSNSDAAELVNLSYFAVINHVFHVFVLFYHTLSRVSLSLPKVMQVIPFPSSVHLDFRLVPF